MKKALDYAAALDCRQVHCMAGIVPADVSHDDGGGGLCREPGLGGGTGGAGRGEGW